MNESLVECHEDLLPSPPTERASRYREMRPVGLSLHSRMLDVDGLVHPRTAARAMGIKVEGRTICFDGGWEIDVLSEYSFYYHRSKGTRHFERVLEQETLSAEEQAFLEANLKSFTSVFEIRDTRPDLWEIDLVDRLGKRGLVTVIDRNASASMPPGILLFARILPHRSFNSTSGVTLPVASPWDEDSEREFVLRRCRGALRSPGKRSPQHALFYICRKLFLRSGLGLNYE